MNISAGSNAFAQTTPAAKVSIRLDWKPGAQHAPFYYAKDKGYYTAAGIDLQIIPGSGSSDSVKQAGAKAVDFALVDALVLVQGAEQRVPVKAIAAYYERTPIVLMSPKAKPVTEVKQLLGDVKLGSKKGSATFQGLVALLGAHNIKMESIKLVRVGPDEILKHRDGISINSVRENIAINADIVTTSNGGIGITTGSNGTVSGAGVIQAQNVNLVAPKSQGTFNVKTRIQPPALNRERGCALFPPMPSPSWCTRTGILTRKSSVGPAL